MNPFKFYGKMFHTPSDSTVKNPGEEQLYEELAEFALG
jgi:hypothetical protein